MKFYRTISILGLNLLLIIIHFNCSNLSTQNISDGTFLPDPEIMSAVPDSSSTIQVIYAQDMEDSVKNAENYTITSDAGELIITSITVVENSNNKIMDITTSSQTPALLYTLAVKNVETKFGRKASKKGVLVNFNGYEVIFDAPDITVKSGSVNYASGGIYNFSSQELKTESQPTIFIIENRGTRELLLYNRPVISIGGTDPSMFILKQPSKTALSPGEECLFEISFSPDSIGDKSAVIHISSNDIDTGDYMLTLVGSGIDTAVVADINSSGSSSPQYLTAYNNKLYFNASDGTNGQELWVYDDQSAVSIGSTASTLCSDGDNPCMVVDIYPGGNSGPKYLTVFNNNLYFQANDGSNGIELWVYDGQSAVSTGSTASTLCSDGDNPCMAADINSGGSSSPGYFIIYDSKLYFSANDGTNGEELWEFDDSKPVDKSNGGDVNEYDECTIVDSDNPCMVADIHSSSWSSPKEFAVYNNVLYFQANHGSYGIELWKYDGSTASLVMDIYLGISGSSPKYLTVYNGKLYFQAIDGTNDNELRVYDDQSAVSTGSTASTLCSDGDNPCMPVDIYPGGNSVPKYLTVFDNNLYFQANDGSNGYELWAYDGTTASMAADIYSGSTGSNPQYLTVCNDKLYFNANDGLYGKELWVYDSSTASMVYDLYINTNNGDPEDLTVFNGRLYFKANGTFTGIELWRHTP